MWPQTRGSSLTSCNDDIAGEERAVAQGTIVNKTESWRGIADRLLLVSLVF
jgi:hypothetical protein